MQLKLGGCVVAQKIYDTNKLWQTAMTAMGRGAYHSPITAFAQTANHAKSTNPASVTLSNTTAGYATLGGRYQFAAPAGATSANVLHAFEIKMTKDEAEFEIDHAEVAKLMVPAGYPGRTPYSQNPMQTIDLTL